MKKCCLLVVVFLSCLFSLHAQDTQPTAQDMYNIAVNCVRANNRVDALRYLTEAIRLDPTMSDAYALSGAIFSEHIVNLLATRPASDIASRDTIAQLVPYCLGQMNNAIQFCNEKSTHSIALLLLTRGDFYADLGYYDKAYADYNEAYSKVKKDEHDVAIDILESRAKIYRMAGDEMSYHLDMSQAITHCKKAIKQDPTDIRFYEKRLNIRYKLGFYNLVEESLFEILEKFPPKTLEEFDDYEAALRLDIPTAKKLLAKKLKKQPDNKNWLYVQALLTFYQKNYTLALQQFDKLEAQCGKLYRLQHGKVSCYFNANCYDKALAMFDKMEATHDSLDYQDRFLKMMICELDGRYEDAIALTEDLLKKPDYQKEILYTRASAYRRLGQDAKAMVDLNTVLQNDSTFTYALLSRAKIHLKYGALDMAKADASRILQVDTVCNGNSVRHYALFIMGREQEAMDWVNNITTTDISRDRYYDAACLFSMMGKTEEAMQQLGKALEAGYAYFNHVRRDNDLDNIRQLPQFMPLVEKYQQLHAEKCAQLIEP